LVKTFYKGEIIWFIRIHQHCCGKTPPEKRPVAMTETALPTIEAPRRLRFDWIPAVLFYPRDTMVKIAEQTTGVWFTPMLVLTIMALLLVWASGPTRQAAALSGPPVQLPEWYTPEQQAQLQTAMAATSGPVFIYVFPALTAIIKLWFGWLIVGGLIHLVLTMFGGRGDTGSVMNTVAWASLPFAVRDGVRLVATLFTKQLVDTPGLAGFAPVGEGNLPLFLASFMALVDIYLIWQIILILLGVRAGNRITTGKAALCVILTLALVLAAQAGIATAMASLGSLTIIRPFF
jgi:hypothetical protein